MHNNNRLQTKKGILIMSEIKKGKAITDIPFDKIYDGMKVVYDDSSGTQIPGNVKLKSEQTKQVVIQAAEDKGGQIFTDRQSDLFYWFFSE